MRAMGAAIRSCTRLVAAIAIFVDKHLPQGHWGRTGGTEKSPPFPDRVTERFCWTCGDARRSITDQNLNIDGRLARLAYCGKRIPGASLLFDPLLFVPNNVEQQNFIFYAGQIFFAVLRVGAIVQRFTGFAMILLPRPSSDAAVEMNVGGVEPFLARLQERV